MDKKEEWYHCYNCVPRQRHCILDLTTMVRRIIWLDREGKYKEHYVKAILRNSCKALKSIVEQRSKK